MKFSLKLPKDGCHNSGLLTIALLLILCTPLTKTLTRSRQLKINENCLKLEKASNCKCSQHRSNLEIDCPYIDPKISIRDNQSIMVHIYCRDLDPFEYKLLPEMNLGKIRGVEMTQCPLPPMRSINVIFQRLGISQVHELYFETRELGGTLKRIHFEELQDLSRLTFNSRDLSNLPENLFDDLGNLTWLQLRSNNSELPPKIFSSLKNLNILQLDSNNLGNLPAGIFRNQEKLTHLNLSSNNLRNLTKNTFEGLSSITELDLRANNIVTFRSDVFSLLTNLKNIDLNGNYFESLPDGLFAENKDLSFFGLYNNRVALKELPARLLGNLPNLREVILSCGLQTITEDLFVSSKDISKITISRNNLTGLPPMLFADQIELPESSVRRSFVP